MSTPSKILSSIESSADRSTEKFQISKAIKPLSTTADLPSQHSPSTAEPSNTFVPEPTSTEHIDLDLGYQLHQQVSFNQKMSRNKTPLGI
jgi:hypothetical protein